MTDTLTAMPDTLLATANITDASLALFKEFAEDAANWNGEPLVGGNVQVTAETRGNLTQIKKAGLVTTDKDEDGNLWLQFTPTGVALAAEMGITW